MAALAFAETEENSMVNRLPNHLSDLLKEVAREYHPEIAHLVESGQLADLTVAERFELREAVGRVLCETGFGADDEPNARGLLLEELIDWLGKPLLHSDQK
jgi:hypothetical protein